MKKIYLISTVILIFSVSVNAQKGWTQQSSPYSSGLSAVYAIDSLDVWAVGRDGLIIHSSNGGTNWDSIPNNTTVSLSTVEFISADTGFVAGREDESSTPWEKRLIQRTTDGGLNWEFQHLPSGGGMMVTDIDFVEGPSGVPLRGYCTGGLSHTWRTDDYGVTWEHVRGDCGEGNFNSCFLVDSITGWFVGTPSNVIPYTIMHTANGGESFEEQTSPVDIKLNGVCFGTDLKGVAVGNAGTVIYTSDGGENWEQSSDFDIQGTTWFSVYLSETGKAWAVGNDGLIAYSPDWGLSWELQVSGVTEPLWEVHFVNDHEGWIVGGLSSNVILHTKTGGQGSTGISDFSDENTKAYKLEQNYPNPFNSSTQIKYTLKKSCNITLAIFDLSGKIVHVLVDEFQTTGEHVVDWDASYLNDGLYFYELKADNNIGEVRKMMLAR